MKQWIKQWIERKWGIVIADRRDYLRLRNNDSYLSLLQEWAKDEGIELPSHYTLTDAMMGKVIMKHADKMSDSVFEENSTLGYLRKAGNVQDEL